MVRARVVALATATVVALLAPAALAEPTKHECIDANTQAQVALKAGRLRAAKAASQTCAAAACPASIVQDCTERLNGVAMRVPQIVLAAKDATGHALTAVRVRLDGKPLTEKLDDTAYDVDPGEHTLTFEVDGQAPVTSTVVLQERDIGHRVEVVIGGKPASAGERPVATPSDAQPVETPPAKSDPGGPRRVAAIVVGGVGVAGLVVGGVLGGLAGSKSSDSKSLCPAAGCAKYNDAVDAHTSAEHLATGSTIGIVAGGVLVAAGVVLWLTAPRQRSVGLAPTTNGAMLVGSF